MKGQTDLEVDDAPVACSDEALTEAMQKAKAQIAQVELAAVRVVCAPKQRRLSSNGRRLAETASFMYWITMASAADAENIANVIEAMPMETLAEKIQAELPAYSVFQVKVTGSSAAASVETVTITTTTTTLYGIEDLDDSHARTPAAFGSVAMAVIAATLTLSH